MPSGGSDLSEMPPRATVVVHLPVGHYGGNTMDFLKDALVVLHLLGVALIVGPFLFQMRTRSGFRFGLILIGAATDVVTGLGLWWIVSGGDRGVAVSWIVVKLVVAVIVLMAVLVAIRLQKRAISAGTSERVSQPWLHVAGGLAIVNVIFAVFAR